MFIETLQYSSASLIASHVCWSLHYIIPEQYQARYMSSAHAAKLKAAVLNATFLIPNLLHFKLLEAPVLKTTS